VIQIEVPPHAEAGETSPWYSIFAQIKAQRLLYNLANKGLDR
jgi:hypothetical protein